MIRNLKAEMERLGLSEAVAMAIVQQDEMSRMVAVNKQTEADCSSGRTEGGQRPVPDVGEDFDGRHLETEASAGWAAAEGTEGLQSRSLGGCREVDRDALCLPSNAATGSLEDVELSNAAAKPNMSEVLPAAEEEEEWASEFDIFADSGTTGFDEGASSTAPALAKESLPGPPASSRTPLRKKKHPGAKVSIPQREARHPMALLSQHCHKCGWAQPRFTRLDSSEPSSWQDDTPRYSVTVDMGWPAR